MTVTGRLRLVKPCAVPIEEDATGWSVDLDKVFNSLHVDDCISYVEYGSTKDSPMCKGEKSNPRRSTATKRFDNQCTVIVRLHDRSRNINIKVFRNGHLQMTGAPDVDAVHEAVSILLRRLSRVMAVDTPTDFRVCLINSDFKLGVTIQRDALYDIIVSVYGMSCTYEPCIYPGVKVQYFHNGQGDGICRCPRHCRGRSVRIRPRLLDGAEGGSNSGPLPAAPAHRSHPPCKKITIVIFQSGSVIITGADRHEQLRIARDFIVGVVRDHIDEVRKPKLMSRDEWMACTTSPVGCTPVVPIGS